MANHLNLAQFSVLAMSAGTMYALALTLAPETQHRVVGKVLPALSLLQTLRVLIPNCCCCCGCRQPQVTLLAPWIPHSSRRAQRGSWLTWAASALPLPLLQAVVGFGNNRIVQQVRKPPCSSQHLEAALTGSPTRPMPTPHMRLCT